MSIHHAHRGTHASRRRLAGPAAVIALLMPALAACGGDDSEPGVGDAGSPAAVKTAANGDVYNDADVEFATNMIPHHAQAIEMVTFTDGRSLDPEIKAMADRIRQAQAPEVEQMAEWLTDWGQEVPATSLDHANAHGEGHGMEDADGTEEAPGMMTAEERAELEVASDAEFEPMFLELMVKHHEGAIEMAQVEQENGEFEKAIALAEEIESAQQAEVEELEALLTR